MNPNATIDIVWVSASLAHFDSFGVVAALVLTLSVLFVATRERDPIVFAVAPGTEMTFPADELVPGDRFSCHGGILPRQGSGYAADASDGTYIETDTEGNVTVRCPEQLAPV
jgi:hypothetical protein